MLPLEHSAILLTCIKHVMIGLENQFSVSCLMYCISGNQESTILDPEVQKVVTYMCMLFFISDLLSIVFPKYTIVYTRIN